MIVSSTGIPFLTRSGKIIPQDSFSTDANNPGVTTEEFQKAAANGIQLIFPRRLITPLHDGLGGLSFNPNVLDTGVQNLLFDNPDAQFILHIAGNPPPAWRTFHTNLAQLKDFDGNISVFCDPASAVFRQSVTAYIQNIVRHVESRPYAASIAGYHINFFEGGEFMLPQGYYGYSDASRAAFQNWLREKYATVEQLNSAWNGDTNISFNDISVPAPAELIAADRGAFRDPFTRQKVIDFCHFWQDSNAGLINECCSAVKNASAGNPITGIFYGYTFETSQSFYKGHSALREILDSPVIDYLSAPYSYVYRIPSARGIEDANIGAGAFHGPVDSILINGKLFFSEDDSRTFLTADESQVGYSRFPDLPETCAMFRRNHLINLCRGSGLWRLDLYSTGWYNSSEIMQELGMQRKLNEHLLQTQNYTDGTYTPDAAVIIDERSMVYVATKGTANTNASPQVSVDKLLRDHLHRAGISCGFYLLDDLVAGRVPDCPVYIFAGTYKIDTSDRAWIDNNLKKDSKTLIWFYGSGLYDETGWGVGRMSSLIGLDIAEAPDPAPSGIRPTAALHAFLSESSWCSTGTLGLSEWYVNHLSINAVVLAEYVHVPSARPAIVFERKENWNTLYIGTTGFNNVNGWFLALVNLIGLQKTVETDVAVPCYSGRGLIGIWPTEPVTGAVNLKERSDVYDLYSGTLLYTNVTSFPVNIPQWQFSAYKTQPPGEKWISGLFYQWQRQYFSEPEITAGTADADKDADKDKFTNFQEFLADTNPCDSTSFPWAVICTDLGGINISFNTSPSRTYLVSTKTNLMAGEWLSFTNIINETNTSVQILDTNKHSQLFYLIKPNFP